MGGSGQAPARGGRRGVSGHSDTNDSSSNSSNNKYGDYGADSASSASKRGGRRGHGGGSSGSGSGSGSNYGSSAFADKLKTPTGKSSSAMDKDDDMFSGLNLPLGETPKSISDKGRKAFNTAIWSPRAGDSNRSKANKGTNNNAANKVSSHIESQMKPIKEKKKAKSSQEPDKKEKPKEKPTFNFDSLYYSDAKPKNKVSTPKAEMDDDLFSNPFGVSGGRAQKETQSRSINVDVKMGNAKLKQKVRSDRDRKQQARKQKSFHRPNSELMFDAFDDLEEEMIDDGVIGNGNKKEQPKRNSSIAPAKQLKWNTKSSQDSHASNASSGRNRGGRRASDDGWF